jgi:protein-S-isoprenylcysteine O-methyltransferase Ste14
MVAVIRWIDPAWLWPGLIVAMAGESLQLWCFACLRKDRVLSTNGPYALCRNPMYIGRFFMILGAIMLLGNAWFVATYVVAYWFYVVNRVEREERKLTELLGEPYDEYCRQVRRFLPQLRVFPGSTLLFFDRERFKKNNALINGLAPAAFYVAAWFFTDSPSDPPALG